MFFWVRLPEGFDALALLPKAVEAGIAFVPGGAFYAHEADARTLRLSFVTLSPELIHEGVALLGQVLRETMEGAVDDALSLRRFSQVDVFTAVPLKGNPLAVVVDAEGLSDAEMQAFARWTNLSETTFLLPPTQPEADYRVRIFTTARELPFAGHPTLGSCHAWLAAGGQPKGADVVQSAASVSSQCGAPLRAAFAFAAPPLLRTGPLDDATLGQVCGAGHRPRRGSGPSVGGQRPRLVRRDAGLPRAAAGAQTRLQGLGTVGAGRRRAAAKGGRGGAADRGG